MATDETTGAAPEEPTTPAAPAAPAAPSAPAAPTSGQQATAAIDGAAHQVQQAFTNVPADPNLPLHIVLAILLPWLEMILAKQVAKGVVFLVAMIVLYGSIIGAPLGALVSLFAVIDSVMLALRRAKGETFGDWDFFWKK